jgi:hypothetical protein
MIYRRTPTPVPGRVCSPAKVHILITAEQAAHTLGCGGSNYFKSAPLDNVNEFYFVLSGVCVCLSLICVHSKNTPV